MGRPLGSPNKPKNLIPDPVTEQSDSRKIPSWGIDTHIGNVVFQDNVVDGGEASTILGIYRIHPDIPMPKFATEGSAAFDVAYHPQGKDFYTGFNKMNRPITRHISSQMNSVQIMPGDRLLVPTGLILDIPKGYSIRLHPRSGLSLKQGLVLANCEAVIDSDYVEELFIMLENISEIGITIQPGTRLAQAELVKSEHYLIRSIDSPPNQKTDRSGGLGSTGLV